MSAVVHTRRPVEIDGVVHRRHIDQLLPAKRNISITDEHQNDDDGVFIPTPPKIPTVQEHRDKTVLRRNPPRNRRPPDRLVLT